MMASVKKVITIKATPGSIHDAIPFDMLRYDQAWPTERGQEKMSHIAGRHSDHAACTAADHTIEVKVYDRWTPDRWASFGWRVEFVRESRI